MKRWMGLATCLFAAAALGQGASAGAGAETGWDLSGQARIRYESRHNFDLNSSVSDTRDGFLSRFRLAATYKGATGWLFTAKVQDSRTTHEMNIFDGVERATDIHEMYLEQTWGPHRFRMGRQALNAAEQRVLGAFEWDNVARTFDGLDYLYKKDKWQWELFGARLGHVRKTAPNPPDFYLFGGRMRYTRGTHAWEALLLWNGTEREQAGEAGAFGGTDFLTLTGRHEWKSGNWKGAEELALQGGTVKGNDHQAWALAGWAEYNWKKGGFLRLGVDAASGDGSSTDGKSREFQNLYHTNHLHYGQMDFFGWRNMEDLYVTAGWKNDKWMVKGSIYDFWLEDAKGRWSNAGGATLGRVASGAAGDHVGIEWDLFASYKFNKSWAVEGGISSFHPGEFADAARGDDSATWYYLQGTYTF